MTDQTAQQPGAENVTRGALVTLLAIPIAMIAFIIVGAVFGGISGIAAIIVPYIAARLYRAGAGAPLSRAGWVPFIGIAGAAILIGTFTGIAAGAWRAFTSVGGQGGILGSPFWRTVSYQFTDGLGDNAIAILIGLGLGTVGISSVIRGRTAGARTGFGRGGRVSPEQVAAVYSQPDPSTPAPPAAPSAPTPPIAPNATSPGIILNGKPLDPDKK